MNRLSTMLALFVLLVGARESAAQKTARPLPRSYVFVGAGYSFAQNDFDDTATVRTNAEDGTYSVGYEVDGGPGINGGIAYRIWRSFGFRAGASRYSSDTAATLTASVPHPFFFNMPRQTSAAIEGLKREEVALHLHALAMMPIGRRIQLSIFGGPTWLRLTQGTVRSFGYRETYPYDTISFGGDTNADSTATKATFGAGADLNFFLTKSIGIGGSFEFARADVDIDAGNGASRSVRTGGAKIGLGIAVRLP